MAAASIANGAIAAILPHWYTATAIFHAISLDGRNAPARVRVFKDFVRTELQPPE